MSQARHSVSVAGAVINDVGEVLAIRRRDNGDWEPPGGVLELHERIQDGLRREILEETGLHVEPETLTGVYQNLPRGIVAFVFRCRPVGGQLQTTDESSEVRWLKTDEIAGFMSEAFAIRLLDAARTPLTDGSAPAIRYHDGRVLERTAT
jgi:ADP-ribose pyrophosphatase YjhB (NUDIX family)